VVVSHTDPNQIYAANWNGETLRLLRKDIAWNEINSRWETYATPTFRRLSADTCRTRDGSR